MTANIGGIDPHKSTFTIGIVDPFTAAVTSESFDNNANGYTQAIETFHTHGVTQVGVEGSASWGAHVAIALAAAGFDVREVSPDRCAVQRKARQMPKTDAVDALCAAWALQADPTLGPAQTLELYDPLVARIEAVLEHRRALVAARVLMLQHIGDQITKLPTPIRDLIDLSGKIEQRLRKLHTIDPASIDPTSAGAYRVAWLQDYIEQDRVLAAQIRRLERELDTMLDQHGTTLRDETGISTINAATLLCEIADPNRFATESKFARWCGTGAVAVSSGEGPNQPTRHRLDLGGNRRINSVFHIISVTQKRDNPDARAYLQRKRAEGKPPRSARRCHKRQLANRVIRRMWKDEQTRHQQQAA